MSAHDLIVPVSSRTLEEIVSGSKGSFKATLESVSTDELLGLLALLNLPNTLSEGGSVAPMQRGLARSFELAQESTTGDFRNNILALFERKRLIAGIKAMHAAKVSFVDQSTVNNRTFLDGSGKWDYRFHKTYKIKDTSPYQVFTTSDSFYLGEEQCRTISALCADIDEATHL
ncbi:MAG: hypothetical protein K8R55_03670, partial [Desulfuromonadaceae bacterium]|nr:hypothetical protein [Desulfuromonadaceae bacterium]